MHQLTFTLEDFKSPERLERLFQRLNQTLGRSPEPSAQPDLQTLAQDLAPLIRVQLQAPGNAPLNLQSLLPESSLGLVLEDTHANRLILHLPAAQKDGALFWETDRRILYIRRTVSGAPAWVYAAGIYRDTFANRPTVTDVGGTNSVGYFFYSTDRTHTWRSDGTSWIVAPQFSAEMRGTLSPDQKPGGFGANDTGFLFYSTDFNHTFRWDGAAWVLASGEMPPGFIGGFAIDPGTGWQLCDGTATTRSTSAGATAAVTVPNYAGGNASYVKFTTVLNAGPVAASGATAGESAHTHGGGTLNTSSDSAGTPTGTNGNNSATQVVTSGVGVTVAAEPHAHVFTGNAMAVHAHASISGNTGAGTSHTHGPGTLEPQRAELVAYYRL